MISKVILKMEFSVSSDLLAKYLKSLACIICIKSNKDIHFCWWRRQANKECGCVIAKIGKKEHMKHLIEYGEVYMNTTEFFRNHKNPEIGDSFEGAMYIKDGRVSTFRKNLFFEKLFCVLNLSEIVSKCNELPYSRCYNDYVKEIIVRYHLGELSGFAPGEEIFMVVIKDVQEFNCRFKVACNKAKAQFVDNRGILYYNEYKIKPDTHISPFMKRQKYMKQNEIRYLVKKSNNIPLVLYLGSLNDIAFVATLKDFSIDSIMPTMMAA